MVNNAGGQFPSPAQMITPNGFAAVIKRYKGFKAANGGTLKLEITERAFLGDLEGLVVGSLLRSDVSDGEVRLFMLETVREDALARLAADDRLELPHHQRVGMRPQHRAEQVPGRLPLELGPGHVLGGVVAADHRRESEGGDDDRRDAVAGRHLLHGAS